MKAPTVFTISTLLLLISSHFVLASDYSVITEGRQFDCKKFSADDDNIYCTHDRARYIYAKSSLDQILYKNETIYPYTYDENKILYALKTRNCRDLISNLYGALFIDNILKTNMYMGVMYDRGICVSKNLQTALKYYRLSKLSNTPLLQPRIQEINHFLQEQEDARRQVIDNQRKEEAQRKRLEQEKRAEQRRLEREKEIEHQKNIATLKAKENELRPLCEKDCMTNKYEYDTSCFKACMHHHGAWWFGTGFLDE